MQKVGAYFQFTVVAPRIAVGFQPGQFVAIAVGGPNSSMVLRRAFALYGATPTDDFAGTIRFIVAEHGPGTQWLVRQPAGATLDIVGPLGTPFPLPSGPVPAVLVGGGYGSAPLIPLAQKLIEAGWRRRDHRRGGHRLAPVRRTGRPPGRRGGDGHHRRRIGRHARSGH